ncbi:MAG: PfkB family carbohydrate kinase, partial [Opitutaceae bacterium]
GVEAAVAALKLAAKIGVRAVLNASPTAAEFPWGDVAIDTVIVNELECRDVCGLAPAELAALASAARTARLSELRIGHLVVTQGAEPTLHVFAENVAEVPVFPVQPRDTVGAGDTFAGALAAELAAGRAWAVALRYANVAAALSTLAVGAQTAMPRRAEVERALGGAASSSG